MSAVYPDLEDILIRMDRILGTNAAAVPNGFNPFHESLKQPDYLYQILLHPANLTDNKIMLYKISTSQTFTFCFCSYFQNKKYYEDDFRRMGLNLPIETLNTQTDQNNIHHCMQTFEEFLQGSISDFPKGIRKIDIDTLESRIVNCPATSKLQLRWSLEPEEIINEVHDVSGFIVCKTI